jgi:hypothetical protein
LYAQGTNEYSSIGYYIKYHYGNVATPPANITTGDQTEIAQYYGLYADYIAFLLTPTNQAEHSLAYAPNNIANILVYFTPSSIKNWQSNPVAPGQPTLTVTYPTSGDPAAYLTYLGNYRQYLDALITFQQTTGVAPHLDWVQAPQAMLAPVLTTPVIISPAQVDNTPSPISTSTNVTCSPMCPRL